jgi:iron complex outermembrane receptor protein
MSNLFNRALVSAGLIFLTSQPALSQSEQSDIDEIVVLSSPFTKSADEIISQTHVILDDDINKNVGTTLGDVVKKVPGLSVSSHGPDVGRPVIRGLSGRRTGSLVNGMTAGDIADTANDHANIMNFYDISRIELLKGPSALRYGPYSTSGVINSFNRLLDEDVESAIEISVGGGTVGDSSTAAIYAARSFDNTVLSVSGFDQEKKNIEIPTHAESALELIEEGEAIVDVSQDVENTSSESDGISASVLFKGTKSNLRLFTNFIDKEYGIPGHAHHGGGHGEEGVKIGLEKEAFRGLLDYQLGSVFDRLEARIHFTNFNQTEFEDGSAGTLLGRDILETKLEFFNSNLENWNGVVGLTFIDSEYVSSGAEAFLPPSENDVASLHIIQAREDGQWSTELGLRYEEVDVSKTTVDKSFDTLNLSGGIGYRLSESNYIGSSISLSDRAPSISELFSDGVHAAASRYERGDVNLSSEEAVGVEVYYRHSNGPTAFQLAAYNNDFDNFIYLKATGEAQIDGKDVFAYRQDDAEIYGFEASLLYSGSWRSGEWTSELNYSNITGELSDGTPLRSIPPEKLGLFTELDFGNYALGLDIVHADEQSDVPSDQNATDAYTEVSTELVWLPAFSTGTVITVAVDNLLDHEIRYHSSELKDKVPEAGRNFKILVTKTF